MFYARITETIHDVIPYIMKENVMSGFHRWILGVVLREILCEIFVDFIEIPRWNHRNILRKIELQKNILSYFWGLDVEITFRLLPRMISGINYWNGYWIIFLNNLNLYGGK